MRSELGCCEAKSTSAGNASRARTITQQTHGTASPIAVDKFRRPILLLGGTHHLKKILMDAQIVGQFRVERSAKKVALPDHHPFAFEERKDVRPAPRRLDPRRADEDARERLAIEPFDFERLLRAFDLASECVAFDFDVQESERRLLRACDFL